jgi:nucleoside-diphosphate-sugar epimerase
MVYEAVPTDDLEYIAQHTSGVWQHFKNARVFISGGTGFIGTWLVQTLLWANATYQLNLKLVVLSRQSLADYNVVHYYRGDVADFAFPAGDFSHVIHAATTACAKLNTNYPEQMLDTIINGTKRILEFAEVAKVNNILFLSSGAVYSQQRSAYALGKNIAEHLCRASQLNIKIARLFAFVGPYLPLDKHYAIGNFIRDGLHGKPINVASDGSAYRSYLYAADLMVWLFNIFCCGKNLYPYNVGSEQAISIHELADVVAAQFKPTPKVVIQHARDHTKTPDRYVPDVMQVRNEFGLQSQINLVDAINKTIFWHQNHAKS